MTDQRRLEAALRTALADHSFDLRSAFAEAERTYGHSPNWFTPGYYDKTLARRYAKILAPRVAELLRGDA